MAVADEATGLRPGAITGSGWFSTGSPYEELALGYQPNGPLARLKSRWRRVLSHLIGLLVTVAILVAFFYWQREQLTQVSWIIGGVVLAISVARLVFAVLAWLQARRILAALEDARRARPLAVRIGRSGVELEGNFCPWPEVAKLAVTKGRLGHGLQLTLQRSGNRASSVPLDQLAVSPATLDGTVRAYSDGRFGVDLKMLGN